MEIHQTGRCLCGQIKYRISGKALAPLSCHCRDCQYLTGGSPNVSFSVAKKDFTLITGVPREYTVKSDSGAENTRCFCGNCGTPVFGVSSRYPHDIVIRVGSLDDPGAFKSEMNVWLCSAQPWHLVDTSIPSYDRGPR